jgi:Tfp pilus assembly protein PilN
MSRPNDDFLPNEYIEHQQDRRMHFAAIVLFVVVLTGVTGAFFVTRADWHHIHKIHDQIAIRYEEAADQVNTLSALEERQSKIAERAELAASLIDRLPRSVLLAQLIERMPEELGLLEFELVAHRLPSATERDPNAPANRPTRAPTAAEASADPRQVAPRWRTAISLLGFAPTDIHVSAFLSALNKHPLLEDVRLDFSEETDLNDLPVRQFRIQASIGPDADCRTQVPLQTAAAGDPSS